MGGSKLVPLARTTGQIYAGLVNKLDAGSTMIRMARQTVEAALFLRASLQSADGTGFDAAKMEEVVQALVVIKTAIDAGVDRDDLLVSASNTSLLRVSASSLFPDNSGCLPGTRHDLLCELTNWLFAAAQTPSQNTLCLYGASGTGKSTVALSIARMVNGLGRLGAAIFIRRDDAASSGARTVVHSVADQLSRFVPVPARGVPGVPLRAEFRRLVLEPLAQAQWTIPGPIILVLDGIDDGADPQASESLLSFVMEDLALLPAAVRVLVTCTQPLKSQHILSRSMPSEPESRRDISTYLRFSLAATRRTKGITNAAWPSDVTLRLLADYAPSFIWAVTATRFVHGSYDPKKRLAFLLAPANKTEQSLAALYRAVLMQSIDWKDPVTAADARRVLSVLGLAQAPLSEMEFDALLGLDDGRASSVLRVLAAIVDWAPGSTARLTHTSIADFLLSPGNRDAEPWRVDSAIGHQLLATSCLRVLNSQLRFNMCEIESSNVDSSDVRLAEQHFSAELLYATRFWGHHLSGAAACDAINEELEAFFSRGALFWLEALSVLGNVGLAAGAVRVALIYAQAHINSLVPLLSDAQRFLSAFSSVIAQNPAHLYISALPFAPKQSLFKQAYRRAFPRLLQYSSPLTEHWPVLQSVLRTHTRGVTSVVFSPDGKHIASGSWDNTIHIIEASSGVLIFEPLIGHANGVTGLAYSADGRRLVSASADRTLRLWDAEKGTPLREPMKGHTESITSVGLSPSGRRIVSGSYDRTVRVWDAETGILVAGPLEGHAGPVHAVSISSDSRRVVSASTDKTCRVWNLGTSAVSPGVIFKMHEHWVNAVAFSPDGRLVLSASNDNVWYIWDAESGAVSLGPISGHKQSSIANVAFSTDGKRVLTGSSDGSLRIWSAENGDLIGLPLEGHTGVVSSVGFSADGRRVISGSDDCSVRVWDIASPQTAPQTPAYYGSITSVQYSPNGKHILASCGDSSIVAFHAISGEVALGPLTGHLGKVTAATYSPDGTHIASASTDESIRIWDFSTGKLGRVLRGHKKAVTALAYAPDGQRIVSGSQDRTIRVWELNPAPSAKPPKQLKLQLHSDWVTCVAFSPSGKHIASASDDQNVFIVDSQTGLVSVGPLKHRNVVTAVAFSPDSRKLVSASRGNTVCLWDCASGALLLGPLEGHGDWVNSVAFSSDGRLIASGSDDRTVRVWDAKTGQLVAGPFIGHSGWVRSVGFSPDGKKVVSGGEDGTIRVWTLELDGGEKSGQMAWGSKPQIRDRWVLNAASERVFRLPAWMKEDVCYPWNEMVIRPEGVERLGMDQFVWGVEWAKCWKPM
ncbi:WD40 repeat protein [Mycena chlorophos]|uniref:WD40 repeat protein n=1 Tax=Mycena chlorophos TaxID=658473 RepID=A0A8H6THV5_MYCCL|nr:WD40 repeat protein [Mycena chlorophos]